MASRYALSIGTAVALLAGCGGLQRAVPSLLRPNSSGARRTAEIQYVAPLLGAHGTLYGTTEAQPGTVFALTP
jgi:hypothetical protein